MHQIVDKNSTNAPLLEQTYARLKEMILDGRIKAGERLLEAQIANAFAISRSPARGALLLLLEEKLVEADERRGFKVAGEVETGSGNAIAKLEPSRIEAPRRWESMYDEVEQELLVQLLYGPVRINELRLAQQYGVSRTVTRDLLARMHGNGLIAKDSAGHWYAQQITPNRIRHLYELRWLLEPQALLHAAPYIPMEMKANARSNLIAALDKPLVESSEFDNVENDLHVNMLGFCRNDEILNALARTHVLFAPTRHLFHPYLSIPAELIRAALCEHLAIVDCLIQNDVENAVEGLRSHLRDAVDRWLRRFAITSKVAKVEMPSYLTGTDGST